MLKEILITLLILSSVVVSFTVGLKSFGYILLVLIFLLFIVDDDYHKKSR